MRIAICDDEVKICNQIAELIREFGAEVSTTDIFESGDKLLTANNNFDIIFLDIQMDGKNGIETAKLIRKNNEKVILIFITGIKEYVFDAFDVKAFHYLLKPIEKNKFGEVFTRAVNEVTGQKDITQVMHIKNKDHNFMVAYNEIIYIENCGRKVEIHTQNKVIETYAVMNELEKQLGENFYRCHRGYIVNMEYIEEYDSNTINLSNGECVYLAKDRYGNFVKEYMKYLKSGGMTNV